MGLEQLRMKAIEQSARGIELTLADLEGVKQLLLSGPTAEPQLGQRLDAIQKQIERELQNIGYVIQQGGLPKSPDLMTLGQKVQEAADEISQI